ncbi:MAG: hypothetical protein O3A95_04900 [Planctomycetota bacterium]|nr:hypothetical protein [Planctomycetota bacterium]MDA1113622.1 hypothetical protein [Planctomycetota bacterium]
MKQRIIVIGICAILVAVGMLAPTVMNAIFDVFDLAFGWAGPFAVVTIVSGLVGVLFILAFPHVSSQKGIKSVKSKISYNLVSIRLFQDDLPTVMRSLGATLTWNFTYLGLNLLPMVVLAAPFMIVWFQLNALYAYQPVHAGSEQMVVVELSESVADPSEVVVTMPDGEVLGSRVNLGKRYNTEDPPVQQAATLLVRYIPSTEGSQALTFSYAGESVTKTVEVDTDPRRLARIRTSDPLGGFVAAVDPIVYFGDPVLPSSSFVRNVTVNYAVAPLWFMAGGEMSIMIWFVVVSMIVGFGLKGPLGVEI